MGGAVPPLPQHALWRGAQLWGEHRDRDIQSLLLHDYIADHSLNVFKEPKTDNRMHLTRHDVMTRNFSPYPSVQTRAGCQIHL
jgi:hypothetical protein